MGRVDVDEFDRRGASRRVLPTSVVTVVVCYFFLGLAANPLRGDARADSGAAVRATE